MLRYVRLAHTGITTFFNTSLEGVLCVFAEVFTVIFSISLNVKILILCMLNVFDALRRVTKVVQIVVKGEQLLVTKTIPAFEADLIGDLESLLRV